jgi:hypothetical protein
VVVEVVNKKVDHNQDYQVDLVVEEVVVVFTLVGLVTLHL